LNRGEPPDPGAIADEVCRQHPRAERHEIWRYLDALIRRKRGPGRPRSFTDDQARRVRQLRDRTPVPSWADVGLMMGWSVIRSARGYPSDCKRARSADAYAREHGLV
jgi:hypothetical protein